MYLHICESRHLYTHKHKVVSLPKTCEENYKLPRLNKGSQFLLNTMSRKEPAQHRLEHYKIVAFGEREQERLKATDKPALPQEQRAKN